MKRSLKVLLLTSSFFVLLTNPAHSQDTSPANNVQILVQSPTPEITAVTGVRANRTDQGVEIILQTSLGDKLQIVNRNAGNDYIADVPSAQLRLPSGNAFAFRSNKPLPSVPEITVTNFDANTIRITVKGEASLPNVELFDSPDEGLIFGIAGAASSTPPGN
ncbi:AMIN domain-containing protein [Nostoc favosum]|uniref:AMIN domain-containing protein n=1 Tax=Nostoc favosum TaxID=2907819 RepID=UPI003F68A1E7